jgi:putative tryptophan/tyrosine transport system substrate-binding protein
MLHTHADMILRLGKAMRRRDLITGIAGSAAAWPLAARAQQPERMRRIGFLRAAPPPERELDAFLRALADRSYVQGRNFVLVPQWGDGNVARLPELAVALVNAAVDIIVAEGTIVARAAAAVTTTVPIVMVGAADPFAGALVKSLSHPGGNVTGFSSLDIDIASKVFEVLKEMVPGLKRIAVLATRTIWTLFAPIQDQAAKELSYIDMPQPEAAGAAMRQALAAGAQGAVVRGGPFFSAVQRRVIIDSAAELRLPVIYERRDDATQGGLVSYSADHLELYRATAGYVARILAGESAGDLPVQQPTKFEFVINLKTANALGLNIPASLLARADEVIE